MEEVISYHGENPPLDNEIVAQVDEPAPARSDYDINRILEENPPLDNEIVAQVDEPSPARSDYDIDRILKEWIDNPNDMEPNTNENELVQGKSGNQFARRQYSLL